MLAFPWHYATAAQPELTPIACNQTGQEHKYTTILSESDIKELEAAMEVLNPEVVDIKVSLQCSNQVLWQIQNIRHSNAHRACYADVGLCCNAAIAHSQ